MPQPRDLVAPLRRDRLRDWTSGSDPELLASKVVQVLATEGQTPRSSGELPWRTAFGSGLHLLRHERNDAVLAELARVYVRDALQRWVPEAEVTHFEVSQDGAELVLRLRVRGRPSGPEMPVELRV